MSEEIRKIIHLDMDAFYASVEQRDNPELRGLPLAVGGTGGRGVIAAASYEARKFGVRSAMPSRLALRKCPTLRFVRPNFDKYKKVSLHIHSIFQRYTSVIEPLALDEAFLDVTYSKYEKQSATLIAKEIKKDIQNELYLTASAGVSYNKFLAKIASDINKPNGLFVILPEEGFEFVQNLPIEKFFGVGKVTAEKMKNKNILFGRDLLPYSKLDLQILFGKMGNWLYDIARGIDHRKVENERQQKSIGAENTFENDLTDEISIKEKYTQIFEKWWQRYEISNKNGRTITLKIRNNQFETTTRSRSSSNYYLDKEKTYQEIYNLLLETLQNEIPIRLLGISISNFESEDTENESKQLTLW